MKKTVLIILTIVLATPLFGQNQRKPTGLKVINILGAKVYEKPTFDSKTLTALPVGENVIIEEQIQSNEKFYIGTGFSFAGKWIKPKGIEGYVFSSDLTDKKVKIGTEEGGQTCLNLLGKLIRKETAEKKVKTPNGEFPKHFEYKYHENGTYTNIAWDGFFDHITEYKKLTLNEVYHQMSSEYVVIMNGDQLLVPEFIEKAENKIKFAVEGATEDLTIELKEEGSIMVTSYDCT